MNRGKTRAILFDYLAGRLNDRHARQVKASLETLAKLHPALYSVLLQAHTHGGDREAVDWRREERAASELGQVFEWMGVERSGVRRSQAAA